MPSLSITEAEAGASKALVPANPLCPLIGSDWLCQPPEYMETAGSSDYRRLVGGWAADQSYMSDRSTQPFLGGIQP